MRALLGLSRLIDGLNDRIGKLVSWLVLAAVLVSAGNAVVRKVFDTSSNAFLEGQWYMFATLFLLSGAYTLLKQEHVRIDVIYLRFSRRTQVGIDIFGTVMFLLPMSLLMLYLCWPYFINAFTSGETSANAGGLIQWPVKMMMPAGFALLTLQGVSEIIKRIAWLKGMAPDPGVKEHHKPAELELAQAIITQRAAAKR
jgi:TRAP-type mannitol/chloroaromatic compound transport system permease small subunit